MNRPRRTRPNRPAAIRRVIAAIAAVAVVAASCADDTATPRPQPTTTAAPVGEGTTTTVAPAATGTTTTDAPVDLDAVSVSLREVASVDSPTSMAARPGSDLLYVTQRPGTVVSLRPDGDRLRVVADPALDLTDRVGSEGLEQGLLGAAFSPDGNTFIASYTNSDGDSRVDAFTMRGDVPDPRSRRELLALDQPHANHNGGSVAFGPDGFLYLGFGDGGSQGDPDDNGQNPGTLLATILRIDPMRPGADPYAVPDDNPFVGGGGRPEVWAYGLRNPWRFSFDRDTGDLWIGDVGGSQREEIDRLPAVDGRNAGRGVNLGWPLREGLRNDDGREGDRSRLVDPLIDISRDGGVCSVVGGYVYRGRAIESLRGVYLWSDYCDSALRLSTVTSPDGRSARTRRVDSARADQLVSFGQDDDGELYTLSLSGAIHRIVSS